MSEQEYFLMHKDIPVAILFISEEKGLTGLRRIQSNSAHFPMAGLSDDAKFLKWWENRMIPSTRLGYKETMEKLGYSNAEKLMVGQLCLSLNDCYWIKPRRSISSWKNVNLFSNDFTDVFGEINLGGDSTLNVWELLSYNPATTQGDLPKKWIVAKDGKRNLIKGNSRPFYQQSLNEVFASELHRKLGSKNFVSYSLTKINLPQGKEKIGCQSSSFTNENIEMVSFWELLQNEKYNRNEPLYYPLKNACLKLGFQESDFDDYMDRMILSDYLLTNVDRDLTNMGILRNPDTLELLGFAPLFDFGNSMFYDLSKEELNNVAFSSIRTKGFTEKEEKMLRYVKNKRCYDFNQIHMDFSIYHNDLESQKERYHLIKELFEKKLLLLKTFQIGRNRSIN